MKKLSPIFEPIKQYPRGFDVLQGVDQKINTLSKQVDAINNKTVTPTKQTFVELLFIGYFADTGNVSVLNNSSSHVSNINGHNYKQSEVLLYLCIPVFTRKPNNTFVQGQKDLPPISNTNSGAGTLYWTRMFIDDNLIVHTDVSYFDGAEHQTHDGLVAVYALCQQTS